MSQTQPIPFLGDYINGQFVRAKRPDGEHRGLSPADLKDETITIEYTFDHVEKACEAARAAYKTWKKTTIEERKTYLNRLKEQYQANKEELARTISRETGKPFWETLTEAQAMINKIDITLNDSMKLVDTVHVPNALPGVDGYIRHHARGVMAVIGPFNFPGHLPNGHIIPALAVGNTVVFKPSEWTPAVGQLMAQLFEKAGFPKGVFNVVHGVAETGKRLVQNEEVDGILFTGSYEVGLKIKQDTLNQYWKILALEMGGKNAAIVWDDADFEKAIYECLTGSYHSTGQRCSCTSRIILSKKIADKFIDRFYALAKKIKIGHWSEQVFMGPLINKSAVEKFIRFQEIAKREEAESLMRGKELETGRPGYYVTPSINLIKNYRQDSVYQQTEIFGPNVGIYTADSLEQAIEMANGTNYGLALSIFTKDRAKYEAVLADADVGILNWNRSTVGASSKLPFGGSKKSGNDRPSGHFAINYCTVPMANLEDTTEFDSTKIVPGIDLK
jgi:succinylglutamic semialdehyde dehydrogenase